MGSLNANNIKIWVNEKDTILYSVLTKRGINKSLIEKKPIIIGDVIIVDIVSKKVLVYIKRCQWYDFANNEIIKSTKNYIDPNIMRKQSLTLRDKTGCNTIFIIEGPFEKFESSKVIIPNKKTSPNVGGIIQQLNMMMIRDKYQIEYSKDTTKTCDIIVSIKNTLNTLALPNVLGNKLDLVLDINTLEKQELSDDELLKLDSRFIKDNNTIDRYNKLRKDKWKELDEKELNINDTSVVVSQSYTAVHDAIKEKQGEKELKFNDDKPILITEVLVSQTDLELKEFMKENKRPKEEFVVDIKKIKEINNEELISTITDEEVVETDLQKLIRKKKEEKTDKTLDDKINDKFNPKRIDDEDMRKKLKKNDELHKNMENNEIPDLVSLEVEEVEEVEDIVDVEPINVMKTREKILTSFRGVGPKTALSITENTSGEFYKIFSDESKEFLNSLESKPTVNVINKLLDYNSNNYIILSQIPLIGSEIIERILEVGSITDITEKNVSRDDFTFDSDAIDNLFKVLFD